MQSKPSDEPRANALAPELLEILVCPKSKAPLVYVAAQDVLVCPTSRLKYRVDGGVPVMLVDEAEELSADAVDRLVRGV